MNDLCGYGCDVILNEEGMVGIVVAKDKSLKVTIQRRSPSRSHVLVCPSCSLLHVARSYVVLYASLLWRGISRSAHLKLPSKSNHKHQSPSEPSHKPPPVDVLDSTVRGLSVCVCRHVYHDKIVCLTLYCVYHTHSSTVPSLASNGYSSLLLQPKGVCVYLSKLGTCV